MDNSNVELITKMVLEAVEKKNAAQSGEGFLVPIGVSARHIHLTQEHVEILWRRLPSYKVQRTYGWTVCIKRKGYNCWS